MFDRNLLVTQPASGPSTIRAEVHEHRAPTDESVRLLAEMETAVRAKIVQSIRVTDTPVEFVLHSYVDMANERTCFEAHFSIGGHRRRVDVAVGSRECFTQVQIAEKIRDAMAADIATLLLSQMIRPHMLPEA